VFVLITYLLVFLFGGPIVDYVAYRMSTGDEAFDAHLLALLALPVVYLLVSAISKAIRNAIPPPKPQRPPQSFPVAPTTTASPPQTPVLARPRSERP
jgi:hypothetical protein